MNYSKNILVFICILCGTYVYGQKKHFSGGFYYSTYICADNSVFTWGNNSVGQLGRDYSECKANVPCRAKNVNNVMSVDAGLGYHCLVVTLDKKVLSWGQNFFGELGSGRYCNDAPDQVCQRQEADYVVGGETGTEYLENVFSVSAGISQSYALLENGKIVSWGDNSFGQLGNGTVYSSASPVYVEKSKGVHLENIIMIASGGVHVYALTKDGNVLAWGSNTHKQLGTRDGNAYKYPQYVVDNNGKPISNVVKISAGANFGLLLLSNGKVMGVGAYKGTNIRSTDEGSELIYTISNHAELVSGGETKNFNLENVVDISAGYSHSLAIIKEEGKKYVVAWGDNRFPDLNSTNGGQLSIGTTSSTQFLTPQYVKMSSNERLCNVQNIHAGCGASYIETYSPEQKDEFWTAGINNFGQLGTLDYKDRDYVETVQMNLCAPICSGFSLGNDLTYCNPINEVIESGLSHVDYVFQWSKNNKKLNGATDSLLQIDSSGLYSLLIRDRSGTCAEQEASVTILEKEKDYSIIHTSFCNDSLEFKVVGTGTYDWYNKKNGTKIGVGNYIRVPKKNAEQVVADSLYKAWIVDKGNCQPQPVATIKKCDCGVIPPPLCFDTTVCFNRSYFVRAVADSVVWYGDKAKTKPLYIGSIYPPKDLEFGEHIIYASNIINQCESAVDSSIILLKNCDSWYEIAGTVLKNKNEASYSRVVLYDSNNFLPLDSCITNSKGEFTLFSDENYVTILAQSNSKTHLDTWVGNKLDRENAHVFFVDAYMGGILINLIPYNVSINKPSNSRAQIDYVKIFSIDGKYMGKDFNQLPKGIYIAKLYYADGSKQTQKFVKP